MGVLKKFEQRLEGLVNGAFAKAFKSDVQPVEIASALKRECDSNATIWNRDRTMVPNDFVVELGAHDYERLSPYAQQLGAELGTMVRDYAQQQRYSFIGPIEVHFEQADDLDTGLYRVRSQALAGSQSQPMPGMPGMQSTPSGPPPGPYQAHQPYGNEGHYGPPGPPPPGAGPQPYGAPQPQYGGPGMPPPPPGPPPGGGHMPQAYGAPQGPPPHAVLRTWLEINGVRHDLTVPAVKLGRSTEADIRVDDPSVSRQHAEIRTTPASITDLGSTNGIVVDGQHCQRANLHDGSRIVLGSTTIVFRQTEG